MRELSAAALKVQAPVGVSKEKVVRPLRPIAEIVEDLAKRIPERLIEKRVQRGKELSYIYIAWRVARRCVAAVDAANARAPSTRGV